MSKLPEQKKTPEEIAALRGQLGIPKMDPTGSAGSAEAVPEPTAPAMAPASAIPRFEPPAAIDPVAEPVIDPISGLPVQRHNADDLDRLRLRGMCETQDEALRLPVRRARSWMVVCGYLVALSTAIPVYQNLPMALPLAIAVLSLAFGAFLFFLRPYSKHHGAFIAMVVLFVMIYAAFHYFPELRYAT